MKRKMPRLAVIRASSPTEQLHTVYDVRQFLRQTAAGDLVTGFLATAQSGVPLGQEAVQMQTIISLVSAGPVFALVPQSLRNLARAGVSFLPLSP